MKSLEVVAVVDWPPSSARMVSSRVLRKESKGKLALFGSSVRAMLERKAKEDKRMNGSHLEDVPGAMAVAIIYKRSV